MRVYHFLPACHALDDLKKRRLKIAQFQDLNDPFELFAADLSDAKYRPHFREWRSEMAQKFGMLCFSRNWQNPMLWSHYADRHKGMCFGFDVKDSLTQAVTYTAQRLSLQIPDDLTESNMRLLLSTKYEDWKYEDEVRVFLQLNTHDSSNGLFFRDFGDDLALVEVIAGPLSTVRESEIKVELGRHRGAVRLKKARLAFKSFKVVEDKRGFRNG